MRPAGSSWTRLVSGWARSATTRRSSSGGGIGVMITSRHRTLRPASIRSPHSLVGNHTRRSGSPFVHHSGSSAHQGTCHLSCRGGGQGGHPCAASRPAGLLRASLAPPDALAWPGEPPRGDALPAPAAYALLLPWAGPCPSGLAPLPSKCPISGRPGHGGEIVRLAPGSGIYRCGQTITGPAEKELGAGA